MHSIRISFIFSGFPRGDQYDIHIERAEDEWKHLENVSAEHWWIQLNSLIKVFFFLSIRVKSMTSRNSIMKITNTVHK